ncbi:MULTISPECIES: M15 family metallopeptidase [unclassified Lactobacillus]|uniref:M15 family metallopeptidase n=1 Tax=unclassified Lactobacillus TaxID=2620435 RepID=UPI0023F82172|nr:MULTISPECIES: M15 family metallopeptidase [unclassified Lactobacillus]MDF7668704.1 M15 family metallopeptidase [Lactobacillus sp. ESL0703]WEV38604.1 M15 family metallopeptidase [Lactobacillus sp. ESL0680]
MTKEKIIAAAKAIKPDPAFLNIQKVDPSIIVDLKYATMDNFTDHVIYDFTTAIARAGTAKKLGVAAKLLKEQGYRIKVWDAFRPSTAQIKMYEVYPHDEWVAAPNPNYSHEKGVTFDLTITDMAGNELLMQSGFDDFTGKALRSYPRTEEQEHNYQILDDAMAKAGFHGYESEWWDYQDDDSDLYEPAQADPNDY